MFDRSIKAIPVPDRRPIVTYLTQCNWRGPGRPKHALEPLRVCRRLQTLVSMVATSTIWRRPVLCDAFQRVLQSLVQGVLVVRLRKKHRAQERSFGSHAALAPRPAMRGGSSFRNNSVPRDEPHAKLPKGPRSETRSLSGTHRQDHRGARGRNSAVAQTWNPDLCGGSTTPVKAATGRCYRTSTCSFSACSGLFLQADRCRGQTGRERRRDKARPDPADFLDVPRLPDRRDAGAGPARGGEDDSRADRGR